jgi:hypothetical protein
MFRTLLLSLALVVAACGGATGGPAPLGDGGRELLSCGDAIWPEDGLDDLPPLSELPEDVLDAVDDVGESVVDRSLPWRVAGRADTEVVLVRELTPDEPEARDGATHAALSLFRVDRDPRIPPGTWHYASGDACTPRLAEGNEGARAEVRLADIPSPGDTSLQLVVKERDCASGRSAEGRVRVDELTLTGTEVRLRVSVVPPDGDQTCPDNPWTPLEVDLGEPLGERAVVDANLVPAAALVVGTAVSALCWPAMLTGGCVSSPGLVAVVGRGQPAVMAAIATTIARQPASNHAGHHVARWLIRSERRWVTNQPATMEVHAIASTGTPTNIPPRTTVVTASGIQPNPRPMQVGGLACCSITVAMPTAARLSTTNPNVTRHAATGRCHDRPVPWELPRGVMLPRCSRWPHPGIRDTPQTVPGVTPIRHGARRAVASADLRDAHARRSHPTSARRSRWWV